MLRSGGDGRGAAVLPISCQRCLSWWAMVLLLSSASFVHSGQCNEGLSPVVSVWCSLVMGCWQQMALLDPKGDPLPGGPCGTRSTPCTPGALWAPAGAVMVGKALPAGIPSPPRSAGQNFSDAFRPFSYRAISAFQIELLPQPPRAFALEAALNESNSSSTGMLPSLRPC